MPTPVAEQPEITQTLRPYVFHGLSFGKPTMGECWTDCPACDRGGKKFSVNIDTGEHKCFACDFHGGHTTFIRWLFDESDKRTPPDMAEQFRLDRGLLERETLSYWSCTVSIISRAWIVAGYSGDGRLVQLYKRIKSGERWELRPTPTLEAGLSNLHGVPLLDQTAQTIYLCEGPWDAMALWESLKGAKSNEGRLEKTVNPKNSLLSTSSVLAVANCGAMGEPFRRFLPLFMGKRVVLCFDNDHSRKQEDRVIDGAGLAAAKRAHAMLQKVAAEVWWLNWTAKKQMPDGWDIRDSLTKAPPTSP